MPVGLSLFVVLVMGRPVSVQTFTVLLSRFVFHRVYQFTSGHRDPPFWRLLWHFLRVLRCFLSARHIPSAWTFRRDQTCRSGRRGLVRVTAVLTQHGVHWPHVYLRWCARRANITYKTENNTLALGKSLMRNNLVGGCFSSTNHKRAVLLALVGDL